MHSISADDRKERLGRHGKRKNRARLLRRPGYVRHPDMAQRNIRRGDHRLHRRYRTEGRAGRPGGKSARRPAPPKSTSTICARSSRKDFIFPMFQAGALYEGQYLLGTQHRAAADRQAHGRDRPRGRRDGHRPRRDRQRQRPGALRADGGRARAGASRSSRRGASRSSASSSRAAPR